MATKNAAAEQDATEEEVEGTIEGAPAEIEEGEQPVETIRLSRRKKEQQERDDRMAALEADRTARSEESARLRAELQQTREHQARMQGALEQISQRQTQPREAPGSAEEPIDRRIAKALKEANAALSPNRAGGADFDAYQEHMLSVMELKAQQIVANQPRPAVQQQAPQQPQKPDWVRAVEFQYPDVLSHPRGQHVVGLVDQLSSDAWGPERLHKAFARARTELGLKPGTPAAAPAARANAGALYGNVETTSAGGRRTQVGSESEVRIPKKNLDEMLKAGLTRTQAAKAWRESYPEG